MVKLAKNELLQGEYSKEYLGLGIGAYQWGSHHLTVLTIFIIIVSGLTLLPKIVIKKFYYKELGPMQSSGLIFLPPICISQHSIRGKCQFSPLINAHPRSPQKIR